MAGLSHYLNVLRQQPDKGRFLLCRFLWFTGLGRFLRIRRDSYDLRFYPSNLSAQLWMDPSARASDELFLEKYLRTGDVLIDVGANIGMITLKAARLVGGEGKVFAFEPNPRVCRFLRGNVRLNGFENVEIHDVALGNEAATVGFENLRWDDMSRVGKGTGGNGAEVPARRLDDFTLDFEGKGIALLKIDVEGFEKFVLEGARETLRATACLYFEVSTEHFAHYGYSVDELFSMIEASGFHIYAWAGDGLGFEAVARAYEPVGAENLLAIRDVDAFQRRIPGSLNAGS